MGWTQRRAAQELRVGLGSFSLYERGEIRPPLEFLERFRQVTGIDVYVLSYALYADLTLLPPKIRELTKALGEEWNRQIELMHHEKHRLPMGFW